MKIKYETVADKMDNNNRFCSASGSMYIDTYEYRISKDNKQMLVKKDVQDNVFERIQADADSCDINLLMKRFAMGEENVLDVRKGYYIDARDLPTTMAEVFDMGLQAQQYFDGLPVELKQEFDNSYTVFYSEMGSKEFDSKVEKYNDRFVNHQFEDVKKEVDVNE